MCSNLLYRVVVPPGTPIFECNKYCQCGIECSNRVVQDGTVSLTNSQMCIFRTVDDKGWGVKTLKVNKTIESYRNFAIVK